MKTAINFKNDPLGKLILKLSVPAFLAIVMNLLYGFVDGIFIGKGISVRKSKKSNDEKNKYKSGHIEKIMYRTLVGENPIKEHHQSHYTY